MAITELITTNPKTALIVISAGITLISTLVTNWLTDQKHLKSLKVRQKELSKKMKTAKPGEKLFEELQSEMLKISGVMMKSQFKPMLVTIVPFLLLFSWLRSVYVPLMGNSWIWYYIIGSIIFSSIYRKLFKMA
ncbi:DUF106 domain-containing protein [archaeon]|nr:DUF106 domain-containing protein [archaeon]